MKKLVDPKGFPPDIGQVFLGRQYDTDHHLQFSFFGLENTRHRLAPGLGFCSSKTCASRMKNNKSINNYH